MQQNMKWRDLIEFVNSHPELLDEDVKGFKTPLYRWKKKHVEAQYKITVVEI